MTGAKVDFDQAVEANLVRKNERSAIEFPYLDLDTAIEVARAVYNRAGLGSSEIDELAAEMGQTVSGAFRLKTGTAKMFGFLDKDSRSLFKLSDLGQRVVSAETESQARAEAFLNIPLYKAVFDKYRGKLLPPPKALEREMAGLGVAQKQTDKARQVFERSARQAGFFAQGDERLVQPRFDREVAPTATAAVSATPPVPKAYYGGGGPTDGGDGDGKPLKYRLIDLLDPKLMTDEEQKAVWTLINYLARDKTKAASDSTPDAA